MIHCATFSLIGGALLVGSQGVAIFIESLTRVATNQGLTAEMENNDRASVKRQRTPPGRRGC
jgi:hypothetical protein